MTLKGILLCAVLALAFSSTSNARAQTSPADAGRPLLPEQARSPLLWTMRGCHALLRGESVEPAAIARCFTELREQLEALPLDPLLQPERDALTALLTADHSGVPPSVLAKQLAEAAYALRDKAGGLRAADGPVVLISQGGISLGSWQAGVLYAITEQLKKKEKRSGATMPTITGASAGAVNGLISASASCENEIDTPEESLFYKVWIELGVVGRHGTPGLLGEQAQTYGLFNEEALQYAMRKAREHFARRDRYVTGGCSVQLGLTATHLDANDVPVHQNVAGETVITGPNLREQFALALKFAPDNPKDGTALTVRNFVPRSPEQRFLDGSPAPPSRFPLLGAVRSADAEISPDQMMRAVQASGAFPGAFPPVTLPFSRLGGDGKPGEVRRARFIDGGVFDNTPVGLAIELDELRKQTQRTASPPKTLAEALVPEAPTTYLLIEPSAISWHFGNEGKDKSNHSDSKGIIDTYASFAGQFIGSSRSAALVETVRRWPFLALEETSGLQSRMIAPRRHMPIAGEQLAAFLGFLERDFRIFDFYVGMADAAKMLERDAFLGPKKGGKVDWSWIKSPKLTCMLKYYETVYRLDQVIDASRLPPECTKLGPELPSGSDARTVRDELDDERQPSDAELAIGSDNFRALLVASHNYRRWTRSEAINVPGAEHYDPGYTKEREFDRFFDELAAANYTFLDLPRANGGSELGSSEDARRAVRSLMQEGIKQLAVEQPDFVSYASIHVLGRAVADQYHTLRPNRILGVGIVAQGIEGVYGTRLLGDWLRLDFGLRFFRLDSMTLERSETFWKADTSIYAQATAVLPVFSLLDLEAGAGGVGSITHVFGERFLAAERFGVRFAAGPTFIQRIYVHGELEYFPRMITYGKFAGYDVPLVRDWRWAVAGGFRFMW